jgi:predicted lipoprotein with Yx(FWY)xxD motif
VGALDLSSPYPPEVSLIDEGKLGYVWRRCPSDLRLYTYDLDKSDRSACTGACETTWTPLLAAPAEKALGHWTIVQRAAGYRQWAYRGKPVYTMFGDMPNDPKGDGAEGGKWHLVPYEK